MSRVKESNGTNKGCVEDKTTKTLEVVVESWNSVKLTIAAAVSSYFQRLLEFVGEVKGCGAAQVGKVPGLTDLQLLLLSCVFVATMWVLRKVLVSGRNVCLCLVNRARRHTRVSESHKGLSVAVARTWVSESLNQNCRTENPLALSVCVCEWHLTCP